MSRTARVERSTKESSVLVELELDELALAHVADFGEAQAIERMSDGLALGIEHAVLERHVDSGFHVASLLERSGADRKSVV